MKTLSQLFIVFLFTTISFNLKGQGYIGGGISFGSLIPGEDALGVIGLSGRGGYQFSETFRGMGDIVFYLDGRENVSFVDLDVNANYILAEGETFTPYALAGLNLIFVGIENFDNETEFSVNLGFGTTIATGGIVSPFVELKGQFFNDENRQYVFSFGVLVEL